MTEEVTQSFQLAPYSSPKPSEMIAFDLAPIKDAHPHLKTMMDWTLEHANPPLTWGTMSTGQYIKKYKVHGVKQQLKTGVLRFEGQTPEQKDAETAEEMRCEFMIFAEEMHNESLRTALVGEAFSDEALRELYHLEPAYYEVSYAENAPATKVLKTKCVIRT